MFDENEFLDSRFYVLLRKILQQLNTKYVLPTKFHQNQVSYSFSLHRCLCPHLTSRTLHLQCLLRHSISKENFHSPTMCLCRKLWRITCQESLLQMKRKRNQHMMWLCSFYRVQLSKCFVDYLYKAKWNILYLPIIHLAALKRKILEFGPSLIFYCFKVSKYCLWIVFTKHITGVSWN